MVTVQRVERWAEEYRQAWEQADPEAAASLFTETARYTSLIFEDAHVGREGIERYWAEVTAEQSSVSVRMGTPVVSGDKAIVEFWTTMSVGGSPMSLAGCLILEFEDGMCRSLREYWNIADRTLLPSSSWGV